MFPALQPDSLGRFASRLRRFRLIIIISVLVLAGVILFTCTRPEPPSYITLRGEVRDIRAQVSATGVLAGQVEVEVGAQVSGQIKKIYVRKGDRVRQGELLVEIDPDIQENSLKNALAEEKLIQAQIKAQEAQVVQLGLENSRQQKLLRRDATSSQEAESAQASYDVARYTLDSLRAQLEQAAVAVADARTNLGYTRITAPIDGTVYGIAVDEGQTVNANQTTPTILKIAKLDVMTVEAEISEADVVSVREGMPASFTILGLRNRTFDAVLRSIDPAPSSADSSSTTTTTTTSASSSTDAIYYNALLDVDNPEGILRIDMTANVTITTASVDQVFAIPVTTLRRDDYESHASVLVLEDGRAVERDIVIGLRDDRFVEVRSGVGPEDLIILGDDVASAERRALDAANARRGPPRI